MAMDNVLAAIARGVDSNYLGQFAEGYGNARKRALAEQELAQQAEANRALNEYRRQSLAVERQKAAQPDIPTSVSEFRLAQQDPAFMEFLLKKAQAANPYIVMGPGSQAVPKPGTNAPTIQGPPRERSAASIKGESDTSTDISDIDSTLATLDEAYDLAPKTYTGGFAGERAKIVTDYPNVSGALGADVKGAEATRRWSDIIGLESMTEMSRVLKGASSDRDVAEFKAVMSDPNASADRKRAVIDRMRNKLGGRRKVLETTLGQFRRENEPGQATSSQITDPSAGGYAPPPGFENFKEGQRYRDKRDGKIYRKVNGQAVPE